MTSEPLNQYTEICRDAIKSSSAKVSKTFENLLLEILLLYMTINSSLKFEIKAKQFYAASQRVL